MFPKSTGEVLTYENEYDETYKFSIFYKGEVEPLKKEISVTTLGWAS